MGGGLGPDGEHAFHRTCGKLLWKTSSKLAPAYVYQRLRQIALPSVQGRTLTNLHNFLYS